MRWSATFMLIVLGLTCLGCGSPTREAAAEAHVTAAVDELAGSRPASAEARLLTAIRLDPASARAGALLHLMRGETGLHLEFYDVTDLVGARGPLPRNEGELVRQTSPAQAGGVLTFDDQEADGPGNLDADKLVEIIEGKLGEDEAGSVEFSSGILIVRKSLPGHEKVLRLLDALRRTAGVMVTVETRFIPDDDFIYIASEPTR